MWFRYFLSIIASVLDDIPGISPATKKKLIRKFGSVSGVKNARKAELIEVVGEAKAQMIRARLKDKNKP